MASLNMMSPSYVPNQPYNSGALQERENNVITNLHLVRVTPLEAPPSHDYPPGCYACPDFFQVDHGLRTSHHIDIEWNYTKRREAQQILPFLHLGPVSATKDLNFLCKEKITLLLAIRSKSSAHARILDGSKVAGSLGIQWDHIDAGDTQELISSLPKAIRRINDHICCCGNHQSGGAHNNNTSQKRVLVYCETGNERSACVVAAYLMVMLNSDVVSTLSNVQARRLSANIDSPMRELLISFKTILNAQKDVALAQRTVGAAPDNFSRKRTFGNVGDSSNDACEDGMDIDSSQNYCRMPQAPFRDLNSG